MARTALVLSEIQESQARTNARACGDDDDAPEYKGHAQDSGLGNSAEPVVAVSALVLHLLAGPVASRRHNDGLAVRLARTRVREGSERVVLTERSLGKCNATERGELLVEVQADSMVG